MRLSKILKATAVVGLASVIAIAMSSTADAQEKVRWKMQSSFGGKLSVIGEGGPRFSENVKVLSGGTLNIKFYEPGALVPALEVFDAVSIGSIDAAWTASGYHTGKFPALSFFTAVPFGPPAAEYLAWIFYGGGREIYESVYAEHGITARHCNLLAPESSGWFKKEIKSAEDLKGLKMRFFGLGAKVMTKMGVSTQLLSAADIYPALERGVLDAAEFSMPSIDLDLGFHEVAKHYYFPGWHQQTTVLELIMNTKKYDALSDQHKAIIDIACGEGIHWGFVRSEGLQFKAMRELEKKGVTIHRWPDEFLKTIKAKWMEVVEEESAKDPLFKKTYDSYTAFRKNYKYWADHGYLK